MTFERFLAVMEKNTRAAYDIMVPKQKEYAGHTGKDLLPDDAVANFKEEGEELEVHPYKVWAIYANKHWRAVRKFCKRGHVTSEDIRQRLLDIINYCHLLLALIEDVEEEARKKEAAKLRAKRR